MSTAPPNQPLTEDELIFIQKECRDKCEAYAALEKANNLSTSDPTQWLKCIKEWNSIQVELKAIRDTEQTAQQEQSEWVVFEQEKDDDWIVVDRE